MSKTPRLVVIGSANMDLVVRVERIPAPGETVLGGAFVTVPGGKGANQAVAAARLGAEVRFVGRVGKDAFGQALRAGLETDGILTDTLLDDPVLPSGVALISVDARGQNAIVVAPGANSGVSPADVEAAREHIAQVDAVVLQLEIPLPTVLRAVEVARAVGTRILLNPAPVRHTEPLPEALLSQIDLLTPNEHEAAALLGLPSPEGQDMTDILRRLHARCPGTVLITLGAEGSLALDQSGVQAFSAPRVQAVDTTAAGDCFSGALAVALAEGRPLAEAVAFASQAAALSVTRLGAQPSLPTRAEVMPLLQQTERRNS